MAVIHHDRDGQPHCGRGKATGQTPLTADPESVTCRGCLRRMDVQPCGTQAAYQRHIAHGEEPCEPCRKAASVYSRAKYEEECARGDRTPGRKQPLKPCGTDSARERHRRRGEHCDICFRELQPCGTTGAYKRHRRRGEEPCPACREAMRTFWRGEQTLRELRPCGTVAAWRRHIRRGEQPCDACREAKRNSYSPHPRVLKPCGTYGAWKRHVRRGEFPCGPCRDAKRERDRRQDGRRRHAVRRRACRRYLATQQEARAAALTIADRARDAAEARELLQMLGLLERPLRLNPDHPHGPLMFMRLLNPATGAAA